MKTNAKILMTIMSFLSVSAYAEVAAGTYELYSLYRDDAGQLVEYVSGRQIQFVKVGQDEIGRNKFVANLMDWGTKGKNINNVEVQYKFGQVHILYDQSETCPIILTPTEARLDGAQTVQQYKYDYCEFEIGRKDFLRKI